MAAASELFLARGYVATTIDAVAVRAGVAVQTVYHAFGTKQRLLAAVLDAAIAGDGEPVPVVRRDWVEDLTRSQDGATAVRELVQGSITIVARTTAMYEVVHRAASDPEIGALLDEIRRRRRADQRHLIRLLAEAGHVSLGVDLDRAADVFYGVVNEEVFRLLTVDCGWTRRRFEEWASAVLQRELGAGAAI